MASINHCLSSTLASDIDKSIDGIKEDPKEQLILKEEDTPMFNSDLYESIECIYCSKNIYYKKEGKNKLNGLNIKCNFCNKYFFITTCPKCKIFYKIKKYIYEGELISCPDDKNCKNQYIQTSCVIADCPDIFYFTKPKNFSNFPNGIIYNHQLKLVFQKITCYHCLRPINFITKDENKINRYYEGMRIICAYEDCKKSFNRLICPKCSAVNIIELGMYIMGSKLKCQNCHYIFAKIICPECLKINPLEKNPFKYGEFICRYSHCSKVSHIANCLHCQKMNIFKLEKGQCLIQGQNIKCSYPDCGKKFASVSCPGCHNINPFINGNFIFGKLYKCIYKAICSKNFMVLVCPKCWSYSKIIENVEGKKYTCIQCKNLLSNFWCPFCYSSILDMDSNYSKGQIMKCPGCENKFSFTRCVECKKLIFYKGNSSILGKSIKCNCGQISVNIICPSCNVRISFSDRDNDIEIGEKINCPNCNQNFEYKENNEENIYYKNLSIINILEGNKIDFGKPQIDENYLETQKILVNFKLYNYNNSSNITENDTECTISKEEDNITKLLKKGICILCQYYDKESIFYPCGHRCTCYKCAVYYYEIFKKCPRCGQESKGIIPKIYNI